MSEMVAVAVANPVEDGELLNVEEVGRRLALKRTSVFGLLKAGAIKSVVIGRARRVRPSALREYIAGLNGSTAQ